MTRFSIAKFFCFDSDSDLDAAKASLVGCRLATASVCVNLTLLASNFLRMFMKVGLSVRISFCFTVLAIFTRYIHATLSSRQETHHFFRRLDLGRSGQEAKKQRDNGMHGTLQKRLRQLGPWLERSCQKKSAFQSASARLEGAIPKHMSLAAAWEHEEAERSKERNRNVQQGDEVSPTKIA